MIGLAGNPLACCQIKSSSHVVFWSLEAAVSRANSLVLI